MGPSQESSLTRWQFLGLLGSAGLTATAGYALYHYAPWLKDDERARQSRRPFPKSAQKASQQRELVRCAGLAASGHNTQPWNQPIEVPKIRGQFRNALGLGLALPQLLVRFGYSESLPQSLRRPVDDLIVPT